MAALLLAPLLALIQDRPATEPDRTLTQDRFGHCVDAAGDWDGDGVPDLWVGDPSEFGWDVDGNTLGNVWCISGRDGATLLKIAAPPGARAFGWTVAGLRDRAAGSTGAVAVGCFNRSTARSSSPELEPGPTIGPPACAEGTVYVFSGPDAALRFLIPGPPDGATFDWISLGAGPTLAAAGDWDGDGAEDLAIGWWCAHGEAPEQGRVQVVSGRDGKILRAWVGMENYDRFGFTLAKLVDLDGDGRAELAASAVPTWTSRPDAPDAKRRQRSGYVRILSSNGVVLRTLHAPDGSPFFGKSLALYPPQDETDSPGLLVGQPFDSEARRVITRWRLSNGELLQRLGRPPLDAWDGGWARENLHPPSTAVCESFGSRVLAVPDRDGDGLADVLVTEPQFFCHVPAGVLSSKPAMERGAEPGASVPIGRVELEEERMWDHMIGHIGISLCSPGDLDADGVDDLVLSGGSTGGSGGDGAVVLVSGKTLHVLHTYFRDGR